ncbi:MAG: response regulator [Oceanospirillaceae bacterium]|nr:response regulator [Oceanospirillaceae bacterium]
MKNRDQVSRSKFTLLFFILLSVTAILGYSGYSALKQELFAEQVLLNESKTEALAVRIDRWLSTRKTEISALANTPVIRAMDWEQSGPFLKAKHESYPWFYIFAQINPDGTYYNSKVDFAKGQNLSDRAHFKASIAGKVYASDPVVSRTLGTDIVAVTSPVFSSDSAGADIIGVFGGMIDTSTIVDELGRFENGEGSYAFAINSSGIAISHPDEARRGNINTKATSMLEDADTGLKESVRLMLTGESGWAKLRVDGVDSYVTFTPITEADWYLATVTNADFIDSQFVIVDYAGAIVAILIFLGFYMIWRSRKLEVQTLNQQREVFAEKSRAKSIFLASMSHELRTPLNAIIGYSQILIAGQRVDDETRKTLNLVLNSGRHLLMLINRVLDLSKIEAGKLELDERSVNPKSLFNELIQIFEIERAKYSVKLHSSVDPELPKAVRLDPDKLTQVVTNITVNAFKYGEGRDVRLDVQHDSGANALVIKVEDSGAGMTDEQVARLFMPFEQANNKSDGAGLGMAIVKELVGLMGGQLYVDSEPQQGTRVTLSLPYIPVEDDGLSLTDMSKLPSAIVGGLTPSVLVVDDNAQNRQFLADLLQPIGFVITEAADGLAAQSLLKQSRFDLIITDLVMPEVDGFELVSWIRNSLSDAQTPIIVASASAFYDDQIRSLSAGANQFMPKPVDPFELLGRVAKLLNFEFAEDESATDRANEANSVIDSVINWQEPTNQSLRRAMLDAANLGQMQKIEQLLESIQDEQRKAQWLKLVGDALDDHDDERIIEVLESVDA